MPEQQQPLPPQPNQPQHGILDKTLGEVLQSNPQAQQLVMKSMGVTQDKFQEMLGSAQQNNLMHMKIRDLFKNGIVQQAVQQQGKGQLTQKQLQQLQNGTMTPEQLQSLQQGANATPQVSQNATLWDKIKKWF
jgi:hypothetical protein